MTLQVFITGLRVAAVAAVAAFGLSACAVSERSAEPGTRLSDIFATPDWAQFTTSKSTAQRAIAPEDLVSADGHCASTPDPAITAQTEGAAPPAAETGDPLSGQGPLPKPQGGIALSMTECQVVQRAGIPDRVEIGADGTERTATITVLRGTWPGLYRFRSGRLVSIEQVEVPPAPKPAKARKPQARTSSMRGVQQ